MAWFRSHSFDPSQWLIASVDGEPAGVCLGDDHLAELNWGYVQHPRRARGAPGARHRPAPARDRLRGGVRAGPGRREARCRLRERHRCAGPLRRGRHEPRTGDRLLAAPDRRAFPVIKESCTDRVDPTGAGFLIAQAGRWRSAPAAWPSSGRRDRARGRRRGRHGCSHRTVSAVTTSPGASSGMPGRVRRHELGAHPAGGRCERHPLLRRRSRRPVGSRPARARPGAAPEGCAASRPGLPRAARASTSRRTEATESPGPTTR